MGGRDKDNTPWRRISQSEIRKIAAAKKEAAKARAGKNSFPQTPFLFARPSVQFGAHLPAEALAKAGSAPSTPFKKGSDFVKQTHIKKSNIKNKK